MTGIDTSTKITEDRATFKLSMLLYDTRYRSQTIQIFALICFLIFVFWIINNTATNLDVLGKELSFKFFGESANYDINQRLVEYTSRDTHLRATFVGLLNTILVAILGCIAATILGVIIGVLRLSKNYIVSRLMAVYVETFRNVPVLLWILLMQAIVTESLPRPQAFRGADPQASMILSDSVALTNRGIYIPTFKMPDSTRAFCTENPSALGAINATDTDDNATNVTGSKPFVSLCKIGVFGDSSLRFNIDLNIVAFFMVLIAGLYGARCIKNEALQKQVVTGTLRITWHLRVGVIILPIFVLFWVLGVHLEYPELKGFNFKGGMHLRSSLIALWVALSLYTAAFIAEIVRAGILAISKGQTEAAYALGIRPGKTMSLVILPQALRVIIPPLISNYLNLTKNSSLAIAVGYLDLNGTLGGITVNQTGRELEGFAVLLLVYLSISLLISGVMNWYNARKQLVEK